MHILGTPLLPCALRVRRALTEKYSIPESWCVSCLHVWLCPVVTVIQMAMEVEDREGGTLGPWGGWNPHADNLKPLAMQRG